ncbi:MAG: hypothetical protein V1726_00530 [Methanobacteriota archaeon]
MVEFEVIKAEEVKFGKNNFIEVARKKALGEGGDREFVSISRGYFLPDGTKKWKSSITLPDEADKKEQISSLITSL